MIAISNLTKRYGPTEVLRGASLEVRRGETAVVIGASGGGKSTLLRCVNALETFDSGTIEVGGIGLHPGPHSGEDEADRKRLRRRVGMVFQQFHLFPHFTIRQNVMSGPIYALGLSVEEAACRAKALLERVGLADKADARPETLSGGQQQRVAIARALANEPEAILFDEPTSALDPRMTREVLAVMADLAASGQTMMVVSHAMGFVRRSASRVHVMVDGRIIESGTPEQVLDSPQSPQTRALLAETGD